LNVAFCYVSSLKTAYLQNDKKRARELRPAYVGRTFLHPCRRLAVPQGGMSVKCRPFFMHIKSEAIMKRIELNSKNGKPENKLALKKISAAMKKKEVFVIETPDSNFNPLGYDRYSAQKWMEFAGGGMLMAIGGGAIVLAFMDPEPTSKLGLLVGGGAVMVLAGGGVILAIVVTRSSYSSEVVFNKKTGNYEWKLLPSKRS